VARVGAEESVVPLAHRCGSKMETRWAFRFPYAESEAVAA